MKYKQWNRAAHDSAAADAMVAAGIPRLAAMVLCARGIDTAEKADAFLDDGLDQLNDPFLMKDMDRAVARVERALAGGESIVVYGDYDVDGITSTTLLADYLAGRGGRVSAYIPDRMEEGYGLNREAVEALAAQGADLIITVDCGITAVEEVDYAHSLGIDVVITDHHECKEVLPAAVAVVDPHRKDCGYPFPCLAGVGVALKLVLALGGPDQRDFLLRRYADLAAIGTVADVMRLTGENRALVRCGLGLLQRPDRPGITALLREAGADGRTVTSTTVGYTLAPRINAAGRMGCARVALELLITRSHARAEELARQLCALNRERQGIEGEIFDQCLSRLARIPADRRRAIVLADSAWHQGVVGIVASRLTERCCAPVFMICLQDGRGKGSCRSFGGFNLFEALESCADLLEGFGGHALAAGFTILEENIPAFTQRMNALVSAFAGEGELISVLEVDAEIDRVDTLTEEGIRSLSVLEPFGAGNPKPVFTLSGATVVSLTDVGGGRHLKMRVNRCDRTFEAIFFSTTAADAGLAAGDKVDIAFYPQINEYRGGRTVQLLVTDLRPAMTRAQTERALYEKFRGGQPITPDEAAALLPTREEFVHLWRYLAGHAGEVEDTVPRLAKNVARSAGRRETYMRTMVCLEVMDERGLIDVHYCSDHVRISTRPVEGKVDLDDSHIMRKLRRMTGR